MNTEYLVTVEQLIGMAASCVLVDARKAHARQASGQTIEAARAQSIFDAEIWWREYSGRKVVLFCVHGHEVSKAGCGFLRDHGVEAYFLEGGFEAWRAAGLPVVSTEGEGR